MPQFKVTIDQGYQNLVGDLEGAILVSTKDGQTCKRPLAEVGFQKNYQATLEQLRKLSKPTSADDYFNTMLDYADNNQSTDHQKIGMLRMALHHFYAESKERFSPKAFEIFQRAAEQAGYDFKTLKTQDDRIDIKGNCLTHLDLLKYEWDSEKIPAQDQLFLLDCIRQDAKKNGANLEDVEYLIQEELVLYRAMIEKLDLQPEDSFWSKMTAAFSGAVMTWALVGFLASLAFPPLAAALGGLGVVGFAVVGVVAGLVAIANALETRSAKVSAHQKKADHDQKVEEHVTVMRRMLDNGELSNNTWWNQAVLSVLSVPMQISLNDESEATHEACKSPDNLGSTKENYAGRSNAQSLMETPPVSAAPQEAAHPEDSPAARRASLSSGSDS